MALEFARGAVQWLNTDALNSTKVISGLPFQPKALRFTISGLQSASDATSTTPSQSLGVGFATSATNRQCLGTFSGQGAASTDGGVMWRDDSCCCLVSGAGAINGRLDISSINSDGFTLIVDVVGSRAVTVFWEAWGGSDITNAEVNSFGEAVATGNSDYVLSGAFQPDVLMLASAQYASGTVNSGLGTDPGIGVGAATSATDQWAFCMNADDGSATIDTDKYGKSGECLAIIVNAGGNPDARASFVQWNANGFRLNWLARTAGGRRTIYLAIKGGQWKAGTGTISTAVGNTTTISGLAFQPVGGLLASHNDVEQSAGVSTLHGELVLGSFKSTTDRGGLGVLDQNGQANTALIHNIHFAAVLPQSHSTSAPNAIDVSAVASDGFTLIIDTVGTGTDFFGYLAFGSAGAGAQTATPTANVITFSQGTATVVAGGVTSQPTANTLTFSNPAANRAAGGVTQVQVANIFTFTNPTADRLTALTQIQIANVLTFTNPSVTVLPGAATRAGTANVFTFTNPTADRTSIFTVGPTANIFTFTNPSATTSIFFARQATSAEFIFSNPAATAVPGAVTLAAAANALTFSQGTATALAAAVTISATANTFTFSNPTTSQVIGGVARVATANTLTFSNPASTTVAGGVIRIATANTLTFSQGTAVGANITTVFATTNVFTFSNPAATVLPGAVARAAAANTFTFTNPGAIVVPGLVIRTATANTVTFSQGAATRVPGAAPVATVANVLTFSNTAVSVAQRNFATASIVTFSQGNATATILTGGQAVANIVTFTNPGAARIAGVVIAPAAAQTFTFTNPAVTVTAILRVTATANTFAFTNPPATVAALALRTATANILTFSSGTATGLNAFTIEALANLLTFNTGVPTILAGGTIRGALANIITFTNAALDVFAGYMPTAIDLTVTVRDWRTSVNARESIGSDLIVRGGSTDVHLRESE